MKLEDNVFNIVQVTLDSRKPPQIDKKATEQQ